MDLLGDTEVVTPFYLVGRAGVGGQGTGTVGPVLARSVWCARSCGALASLGRQTTVPTLNLKSLGFAAKFLSGVGRQGALAAPEGELAAKPRDACCVLVTRRRARHAPAKLVWYLCTGAHGAAQTHGRGCILGFDELNFKGWPWVQPWL